MGIEAHMHSWRVEQLLIIGVIVSPHAEDKTPMVAVVESVFTENTRDMFNAPIKAVGQNLFGMATLGAAQVFLVFVVGITGSHRILVHLIDNV